MSRRSLVPPILLATAVIAVFAATRPRDGGDETGALVATVVHVVDGDTVRARVDGIEERVRYIGVDTPESGRPGAPRQCFARAASELNARLVAGRRVRLVADVERRDRYGRLLAYVYREPDGLFVNAELVRRGYARTLTIAPNVRFAGRFGALARAARAAGDGLWGGC